MIISDSFTVCLALSFPKNTPLLRTFRSLLSPHFTEINLLWVPGHAGITFNETADSLARVALSGPVVDVVEPTPLITAARYRRMLKLQVQKESVLFSLRNFNLLKFSWKPEWCPSRNLEVVITALRCRVPKLNRYLHRSRLAPTALCSYCNEDESVDHYLLTCRRFSRLRRQSLEVPLCSLGISLTVPAILSFGHPKRGYAAGMYALPSCATLKIQNDSLYDCDWSPSL